MRTLLFLSLLFSLVAAACGGPVPFPKGKESYVGSWSFVSKDGSETVALNITSDAFVEEATASSDGSQGSLSGPISEWKGDNFVVFVHEFKVARTPHDVPSTCEIDVDCAFDETCGDGACHDKAGKLVNVSEMDIDGKLLDKR